MSTHGGHLPCFHPSHYIREELDAREWSRAPVPCMLRQAAATERALSEFRELLVKRIKFCEHIIETAVADLPYTREAHDNHVSVLTTLDRLLAESPHA